MQRIVLPIILLAIAITAWVVSDRENGDDLVPVATDDPSVVTPVLSARRLPETLTVPQADEALRAALQRVVDISPELNCLVVHEEGREVFSSDADLALVPASTLKIATGFVALQELGPDATYRTVVAVEELPVDGIVNGELWLIGGGDPILATDDYIATFEDQPQIHTRFEDLADAIVAQGVTEIRGGIVADEGRYDQDRYPDQWPDRFAQQGQSGPLGAMIVNDGFVSFPEVQDAGLNPTPASNPAEHAATVLTDLLRERGLAVAGNGRADAGPFGLVELAAIESPPVSEIVAQMLTQSDNTTAELLLKELGRARGAEGTTQSGANALLDSLTDEGLAISGLFLVDGSGLAGENRMSCQQTMLLLERAGPDSALAEGLPVAGESGTLRDRFTVAAGRLRAKTGSLLQTTALSGFVETIPGELLTFSYIAERSEDEGGITDADIAIQDELVAALVEYPVGPPVSELEPLPLGSTALAAAPSAGLVPSGSSLIGDPGTSETEVEDTADDGSADDPGVDDSGEVPAEETDDLGPDE